METILSCRLLGAGKRLYLESCTVQLSVGHIVEFERLTFGDKGSGVMIIPITDQGNIILVEHFCVGTEQKEYVLPGGVREKGMSLEEIANKELQEEIGYKASYIHKLITLDILPGYVQAQTTLCLASGLTPSKLPGDEHEALTVHMFEWQEIIKAIKNNTIRDARTIAGLLYYHTYIYDTQDSVKY